MRQYLTPALAALLAAAATAGVAFAGHPDGLSHEREAHEGHDASYSIGLWGDLPYCDVQETAGVPNLIADINSQRARVQRPRR